MTWCERVAGCRLKGAWLPAAEMRYHPAITHNSRYEQHKCTPPETEVGYDSV